MSGLSKLWNVLGRLGMAGCCLLILAGCRTVPRDTVTQVSTIDALLAGAYDGVMPCAQLTQFGDLGIGTFAGLDGEMVLLGREIFQVRADGHVYRPGPGSTTPFASVVQFHAETNILVSAGADFPALQRLIDSVSPQTNLLCAVKFEGRFRRMQTRSVPAQNKPYPPLVEVTKNQPVFNYQEVEGTLVGFRLPSYVKGVNVPGYHLHFLSQDRQTGGHVLSFEIAEGTVALDNCHRYVMVLPQGEGGFSGIDFNKDRSHELEKAEK